LGNNARGSFVCDVETGFAVRFLVPSMAARLASVHVFPVVSAHEVHSKLAFMTVLTRTLRVTMASKSGLKGIEHRTERVNAGWIKQNGGIVRKI
jgi:hypothetical protein